VATGAKECAVPHPAMQQGDHFPGCEKGKVYPQREPRTLGRVVGQAPLAATVYELDRLRCNLCGEIFTTPEPQGVGPEKYDETTAAMIALLKYGSGMLSYRLEKTEHLLGIPLPASTQGEIVEEEAEVIKAARDELIRQAAQGEVLHNDDTGMRMLHMAREPGDDRPGVFTSGIVSTQEGCQDRFVLHRTPARRRKPAQRARASCRSTDRASADVRRTVAHLSSASRVSRRRRGSATQLPCAWKKAVRGSGRELPGSLPLRPRNAGQRI
jgi:hypothetical protein